MKLIRETKPIDKKIGLNARNSAKIRRKPKLIQDSVWEP